MSSGVCTRSQHEGELTQPPLKLLFFVHTSDQPPVPSLHPCFRLLSMSFNFTGGPTAYPTMFSTMAALKKKCRLLVVVCCAACGERANAACLIEHNVLPPTRMGGTGRGQEGGQPATRRKAACRVSGVYWSVNGYIMWSGPQLYLPGVFMNCLFAD